MKTRLSILLHLAFLTINAQDTLPEAAQPVHAFYIIGAGPYLIDTFLIDNETVDTFDNVAWTPIYRMRYWADSNMPTPSSPTIVAHQRVEGDRVYLREDRYFYGLKQGLMYDFGAETGDSIWLLAPEDITTDIDSFLHVIDSVKYVNCGFADSIKMIYHTALYDPNLSFPFYSDVWIEGIGSIWHGFFPLACVDVISPLCEIYHLIHYATYNGEWIEPRHVMCEEILTSVEQLIERNLSTVISPNPVQGDKILRIMPVDYKLDKIIVYDASGQQVMDVPTTDRSEMKLDLSRLDTGLYFIKLFSQAGRIDVKKVVVR